MTLPVATLDHVVINARDDMDRAADIYTRLGFTLTERGYHSLGSMNHLAMFGTDYLELIAVPKGATSGRLDLLNFPFGLNGLVFGSEDSAVTYASLTKAGVPIEAPVEFTRPVKFDRRPGRCALPHGAHEVRRRALWPRLLLPSLHARPGVARRMAPSRQRHRGDRARADRRARSRRGRQALCRHVRARVACATSRAARPSWSAIRASTSSPRPPSRPSSATPCPIAEGRKAYMAGLTFRTVVVGQERRAPCRRARIDCRPKSPAESSFPPSRP